MSAHASGTFQVTSWDEKTYEQLDGAAKLTHARIRQDFAGDLEGNGSWEVLMCYAADGTAVYTGFVRVRGRLANNTGTAVLQTDGGFDGSEARWTWSVVPGSGTDQWLGLRGKGTVARHTARPGRSRSTSTSILLRPAPTARYVCRRRGAN